MSVASPHPGDRDGGLARGLGLRGIPTRSLVEFEGGGSMLSREVLGEMLAANEHGTARGGVAKTRSSKKQLRGKRGSPSPTRRAEEWHGGGAAGERGRARLLCQADALAWLRESSAAQTALRWPTTDGAAVLQRGRSGGHSSDQQQVVWRKNDLVAVDSDRVARAAISTITGKARSSSPPIKRRRHPPVKLYDHVHNPRVLRALIDDTVTTGIAGAGALMAEEEKRMEELRLQLRLVCHRATELQDQMFQCQTGAPHRELLGELHQDQTRNVGARVPDGGQGNTRSDPDFAGNGEVAAETVDLSDRCTSSRRGVRSNQQLVRTLKSEQRVSTETTTASMSSECFTTARRSTVPAFKLRNAQPQIADYYCHGQTTLNDPSVPRTLGTQLPISLGSKDTRWENMPAVVTTCNPPLSPLLTPTTSLRRYLSSLRPFSADSARAAWGLAEPPPGGKLWGPSDPGRFQYIGPLDGGKRGPRWPVLFVMGSAKPSPRHPLDVHALPFFDDDMIALLAGASGEPVEKVLAMTQVLSRFDFGLLLAAVERLCCAHATTGDVLRSEKRGRGKSSRRSRAALVSATQAGERKEGAATARAVDALGNGIAEEGKEFCSEPLIITEATAKRVLTGGFLCGVFGDSAVRDIVGASRPAVVFGSAEVKGVAASTLEGKSVGARKRSTIWDQHEDSTAMNDLRQPKDDDGSRGRSDDVGGNYPIAATANGNGPPSPLRLLEGPKKNESSEEQHSLDATTNSSSTSASIALAEGSTRPANHTSGRRQPPSDGGKDVLVAQLVRVTAARFRVHSLAVRHRDGGIPANSSTRSSSSSSALQSRGVFNPLVDRDLLCGGFDRIGLAEGEGRRRRPASAGSDELGLPPLKFIKRAKNRGGPRPAWAPSCGHGGGERQRYLDSGGQEEEDDKEEYVDVSGVQSSRSTPRCLRPGFKGEVTAAMLREELEKSENTAARIGISMARKAEAWKFESQEGGTTAAAAAAAAHRAALDLASDRARTALLEAAQSRMRDAMHRMYLGIIRRRWKAWRNLTRSQRSLQAAERVARLIGAAALTSGVLEPLLRRRKRAWLHQWAAAMRAERVLEVQAAAVELQRTVRGFLGRARARGRRHKLAATEIQRLSRGRAGRARGARRARVLKELRAVQVIERKLCEIVRKRDAAKLLELRERERAATGVQAAWRGLVYGRRRVRVLRKMRREKASVVMLQRLWRGVVARGKADTLMEEKRQRQAATRIQAVSRGRQARNVYCPIILRERSAAKLSRCWRCTQAKKLARRKRARLRLATLVNPAVRGFLARVATRAIREERGRRQRAMLLVSIAAQKFFRGKQGRLKARRELLHKCAAIELQRAARNFLMRRVSRVVEQGQRRNLATWMAAAGVQRLWRGLQGRRKFGQREAEERRWAAAFTIQSAYRRARKERRKSERARLRKAAGKGQSQLAGDPTDRSQDFSALIEKARSGGVDGGVEKADGTAGGPGPSGEVVERRADASKKTDAAADASGEDAVPFSPSSGDLEDVGDVALAAVSLLRRKTAEEPPPTSPPIPSATISDQGSTPESLVAEAGPARLPPGWEFTLEYYEAKARYMAAQEAAHGMSAAKIQAMYRAFVARREVMVIRANRDEFMRRRLEEARATVILQSGLRGRAARRMAAQKRKAIVDAARRETGLLVIQYAVRCFLAKCRLRRLIEARQAKRDLLDRMAIRIQARMRGAQTREVWRKFFKSRALLKRERQRKGAQQIQASWRSKLARTEAERRKSVRDAALLAEELERHLKGLLEAALLAERKHAYAIRLQCWWRGILAVRVKLRTRRALNEIPLAEVEGGQENASIVIQCHWRAFKARQSYYESYASLFRDRERKKYCTECQGEYATRRCRTCLDKFCDSCWARIHSKGARRFHHWEPFTTFSYEASYGQQQSAPGLIADDTDYYGYVPDWNSTAEAWASVGYGGLQEDGSGGKDGAGGETLAIEHDHDPNSGYGQVSEYGGYSGSESYGYPGSEGYGDQSYGNQSYGSQSWYGADQQQSVSPAAVDMYGGAASYDGASGSHFSGLTHDTSTSSAIINPGDNQSTWGTQGYGYGNSRPDIYSGGGDGGTDAGSQGEWAVATTAQDWDGVTPEVAEYYGYDSAVTFGVVDQASSGDVGGGAIAATDWNGGWATSDAANGSSGGYASISSYGGGGAVGTSGTDGGASGERTTTSSSDRPWSVNEFGQRVCGDWVEYWDDSAQAAYFYNTATGEASWTEPATG